MYYIANTEETLNDVKLAKERAINMSAMLLCLHLQDDLSAETYEHLNNAVLWILHNIIYRISEIDAKKEKRKKV